MGSLLLQCAILAGILSVIQGASECYLYTCTEIHESEGGKCENEVTEKRTTLNCPVDTSCIKRITHDGGSTSFFYGCAKVKHDESEDCEKMLDQDRMECFCNKDLCNSASRLSLTPLLLLSLSTLFALR